MLPQLSPSGIQLSELVYLTSHSLIWLSQLIDFSRKLTTHSKVVDYPSKKPLPHAIVRLFKLPEERLIETEVTDDDGDFSFTLSKGSYYMKATKDGYAPADSIRVKITDDDYSIWYTGGIIQVVSERETLKVIVPMIEEDGKKKITVYRKPIMNALLPYIYAIGLLISIHFFIKRYYLIDLIVLIVYFSILILLSWKSLVSQRKFGLLANESGKPLAGVELQLIDMRFERMMDKRITDDRGRFYFLAQPGEYRISVKDEDYQMVQLEGLDGAKLKVDGDPGEKVWLAPVVIASKR